MVKIRMARGGSKKRPFYRIVIADARSPRDGRFIDQLGFYNPVAVPKVLKLDMDKYDAWVAKGAQATETVARLAGQLRAGGESA